MRLAATFIVVVAVLAGPPPAPLGLDAFRPTPPDNPLTAEKIALGRRLFRDRRLSGRGAMACATCHDPERAFTSAGLRGGARSAGGSRRNVPTLINRAYGASFFWDGRAASLELQVPQPLLDPEEMSTTPQAVVRLVQGDAGYRRQFLAAFGRPPAFDDVVRALASYVRSIRSGWSRYDRFRNGDRSALDAWELRGLGVFLGKARCWTCHAGMNLTDERFHNTGVAFQGGRLLDDGRYAVTGRQEDRGAFKTPTLRDVARTAPYMHDGSLATLEAVIDHYDRGGRPNPALDPLLRPIGLTAAEKRALAAFLRALNGRIEEGR